ncbi:hypothetical protein FisN_4Lu587 [Fistulifera solaris]|uniref:Uncharacterized protein n=1 Tax=Fistulifera solaris TaxID=1519565 RepID=A0A1Z5JZL5_FISSO|nr:hypothetical protein FisN_4Lu587 [Fistulifera solaris]|eukprot:GAX19211.1 hypothetical protein FisN_4Lu587 [Fistulifera solaris]
MDVNQGVKNRNVSEETEVVSKGSSTGNESSVTLLLPPASLSNKQAPEHIITALRLSRAHKTHIDRIMKTLVIEMDVLRNIDHLCEREDRLTEQEVLDYFESVGRCLDQRRQSGADLQHELDPISRGSPLQEEPSLPIMLN